MHHVTIGDWAHLGADASKVRTAVFVDEQGIPLAMEWDEADALCTHAVVYGDDREPLATGRLLPSETDATNGQSSSRIGRMAVLRPMRGQGLGEAILQALMQSAKARGDTQIVLHAQCSAENFYAKQGFEKQGPRYEEVGIPHQDMVFRF